MATLDELRLQQLLRPLEGPGGIVSLNPLAFQYQDQFYPNQMQYQYPPRTDISPTQDFYPPRTDISPTQDFYPERNFVNAPQNFYPPDLTTLRGLDMNRFQGVSDRSIIDETTNDEEDQNYINQVEKSNNPLKGILDFIGQFSPIQMVGRGLAALSDKLKQSSMYRPSTTGVFGYTPAQLNQMNALGGFYSAPERERRRRANRISNMLNRAAEGKNYSKKNLSNLMNQFGMGDVDTGSMIQSIKESSNMGYGKGDVGQAATPGRDYSSSPGAMAGDMEYGEE
jgi:hypothetical protein